MFGNKLRFVAGVLILAGIFISGCTMSQASEQELWGRADAKEIDINSKIAGRVVALSIKEGDLVEEGEIIAEIDRRDLTAQKAQAEANIKAIQAQQEQAAFVTNMQRATTQSALEQTQAAQKRAEADLNLARADYERYKSLLESGAVSMQTFEQYRAKYLAADAVYSQAAAATAQAEANLMQTEINKSDETATAERLEQAFAALRQIEIALDETEIKAPFVGVITEKYVEEGSMISQGTPLFSIQDSADNWIDLKIPETRLSEFYLNQSIELEARDGVTKITGVVTDISKKAEFATQRATSERGDATDIISFNVKIQTDNKNVRPGMRFKVVKKSNESLDFAGRL